MSVITLTLDGATMDRHTTDPDLDDLYAAGWTKVPGLGVHGHIKTPNFPRMDGKTGTTVTGAARRDWVRVQLDEPVEMRGGTEQFVAVPASCFIPDATPAPRTFGYNLVTVAPDGSHKGPRFQSAVTREDAEYELEKLVPFMIDGYTTVLVELREVTR